jgi:hypothetical protein
MIFVKLYPCFGIGGIASIAAWIAMAGMWEPIAS